MPTKPRISRFSYIVRCAALSLLALVVVGCSSDPEPVAVADPMEAIRAQQESGAFADSLPILEEILAGDSSNLEAHYRLGLALQWSARPSEAVWPLLRAAESQQYRVEAGTALAGVFLAGGNFADAIRNAERVLEAAPDHLPVRAIYGSALLGENRPEEALAQADALLQANPDDAQALTLRANTLTKLERFDEAEEVLLALNKQAEEAGQPDRAARGCMGLVSFFADEVEDADRAEGALEKCLADYPSHALVLHGASAFYEKGEQPAKATEVWQAAFDATPDAAGVRLGLIERLQEIEEYGKAEALLIEVTDSEPGPVVWQMLSDLHRRAGNIAAAVDALGKAIEASGRQPGLLLFAQADLIVELGEFERASALADEIEDPGLSALIHGRVLAAQGRYAEAMKAFDVGLPAWPNNAPARLLVGQTAEKLGDAPRALQEYRAAYRADRNGDEGPLAAARLYLALGEYDEAFHFASLRLGSENEAPAAHRLAARAALGLGQHARARALVDRLEALVGQELAAAIDAAAVLNATDGPAAAAAALQSRGLDLADPSNREALGAVVEYLTDQGKVTRALALVDGAAEKDREAADLYDLRGRLLANLDRSDKAEAAFEKALSVDADYAPALAGLATLAAAAGDTEGAIELFDRSARSDVSLVASHYGAAQLVLLSGDVDGAETRLRALLKAAPQHADACNDLAWILAEKGQDLDRALELALRAVRQHAEANTLDTLGWVRMARREYDLAEKALRRAVRKDPQAASIRYRLGQALEAGGDTDNAGRAYREALDSGGSFAEAEAARQALARLQAGRAKP